MPETHPTHSPSPGTHDCRVEQGADFPRSILRQLGAATNWTVRFGLAHRAHRPQCHRPLLDVVALDCAFEAERVRVHLESDTIAGIATQPHDAARALRAFTSFRHADSRARQNARRIVQILLYKLRHSHALTFTTVASQRGGAFLPVLSWVSYDEVAVHFPNDPSQTIHYKYYRAVIDPPDIASCSLVALDSRRTSLIVIQRDPRACHVQVEVTHLGPVPVLPY